MCLWAAYFRASATPMSAMHGAASIWKPPGWFVRGRLVWSAGGEGEVSAHRLQASDVVLELLEEPPTLPSVGAAFTVYAGCDKRAATCRAKFANTANFRGFPHMPGNDFVTRIARAGASTN